MFGKWTFTTWLISYKLFTGIISSFLLFVSKIKTSWAGARNSPMSKQQDDFVFPKVFLYLRTVNFCKATFRVQVILLISNKCQGINQKILVMMNHEKHLEDSFVMVYQ